MEYDLKTQVKPLTALKPGDYSAKTAGEIIDTLGFESLTLIANASTVGGATAFKVEHGDASDLSDAAEVPADLLLGGPLALATADANKCKWVGYIGKKGFVRVTLESGDATCGVVALMGHPYYIPTE